MNFQIYAKARDVLTKIGLANYSRIMKPDYENGKDDFSIEFRYTDICDRKDRRHDGDGISCMRPECMLKMISIAKDMIGCDIVFDSYHLELI